MKKLLIVLIFSCLFACSNGVNIFSLKQVSFKVSKEYNSDCINLSEMDLYYFEKDDNIMFSVGEFNTEPLITSYAFLKNLQQKNIKYTTVVDGYLTKVFYTDKVPYCFLIVRKDEKSKPLGNYLFYCSNLSKSDFKKLMDSVQYISN